jgi:hypothetical protein
MPRKQGRLILDPWFGVRTNVGQLLRKRHMINAIVNKVINNQPNNFDCLKN